MSPRHARPARRSWAASYLVGIAWVATSIAYLVVST